MYNSEVRGRLITGDKSFGQISQGNYCTNSCKNTCVVVFGSSGWIDNVWNWRLFNFPDIDKGNWNVGRK